MVNTIPSPASNVNTVKLKGLLTSEFSKIFWSDADILCVKAELIKTKSFEPLFNQSLSVKLPDFIDPVTHVHALQCRHLSAI